MKNIYGEILSQLRENHIVALTSVVQGERGLIAEGIRRRLDEVKPMLDSKGRNVVNVSTQTEDGVTTISEPVYPWERLIILGGGHIALPVCQFAVACGFTVCVVDDRPSFANTGRFPEASQVICDSFENGIRRLAVTPFDYVVVITRGHQHDADCLRAIVPQVQPAYLGMIGSRRRVKGLMRLLEEEGLDAERLKRVCTPIGLNIGAVTPAEIAVSIMAEIIAHKRLAEYGDPGHCCNSSDLELSLLEYLAENHEPKAIVTVTETKGSTPRGAGAKMAVSPLGQVTGSIGGGCSEAAVIRDAIAIIGTGRYKFVDIDLTGEIAEEDGMVCGGVMRVLVEDGTEN